MEDRCPLCGEGLTEEEGLLWCDVCGINNHSKSFIDAVEASGESDRDDRLFVDGAI